MRHRAAAGSVKDEAVPAWCPAYGMDIFLSACARSACEGRRVSTSSVGFGFTNGEVER